MHAQYVEGSSNCGIFKLWNLRIVHARRAARGCGCNLDCRNSEPQVQQARGGYQLHASDLAVSDLASHRFRDTRAAVCSLAAT